MNSFRIKYPTLPTSSFITVSSSASNHYFPNNLNYDFTNKLCNPTLQNGTHLEVGLVDLYFTPSAEQQKKSIFEHAGDNKITVVTQYISEHLVNKTVGRIQ